MKKTTLFFTLIFLVVTSAFAQYRETMDYASFDDIKLDGNIRLYLRQGSDITVDFEARKASHLDDYRIEVRSNTLYIGYDDHHNFRSTPKIKVYVTHPALEGIDADGLVHINSENTINGERLAIKGDGFIRGSVEVDVENLRVDLDGFCFMSFSGAADRSELKLDGFGRINAGDLESDEVRKSADGLAGIKVME